MSLVRAAAASAVLLLGAASPGCASDDAASTWTKADASHDGGADAAPNDGSDASKIDGPSDVSPAPDATDAAQESQVSDGAAETALPACNPPRHYRFTLEPGQEKVLPCTPGSVDLLDVQVPDQGYAVGKASFVFANSGTQQTIYYWNAQVVVGTAIHSYASGDDICPGANSGVKSVIGYGKLDSASASVKVVSRQGASPCVDGEIVVWSGGYLDVWVEDAASHCHGTDIQVASWYGSHGFTDRWYWTTSFAPILTLDPSVAPGRTRAMLLASTEGTIEANPNQQCGSEAATLASRIMLDGAQADAVAEAIPASMGMGHLVLDHDVEVSVTMGPHTVALELGSNTGFSQVFTGECCGDAMIAAVLLPPE
jgi:hypothetical protein